MLIGVNAPPHVTLLQIDCSLEDAQLWWRRTTSRFNSAISIQLAGLLFKPIPKGNYHNPEGGIHVGLEAVRRADLERAHNYTVHSADKINGRMLTPTGEDFRPHVTLAVLSGIPSVTLDLPSEIVTRRFDARVALGVLGDYGTFPEIIHVLE